MAEVTVTPAPPTSKREIPSQSGEEFLFRLLGEAFEETNTQIGRVLDMERAIVELSAQLRAWSHSEDARRTPVLKDEVDAYLEDLDDEMLTAFGSGEDKPWVERGTLLQDGVDPKEQWADSYREQKARMAPMFSRLLGYAYAAGVLPRARPTAYRIVQARSRDYGLETEESDLVRVEGVNDGQAAHGDDAPPPVHHAELRARFRFGKFVPDGPDPVRTRKSPAGRGADFDSQFHGG